MIAKKQLPLLKLLLRNISILQLAGYALAALTGISILLAGFCFSKDIHPLFSSDTRLFREERMVINKKVSALATLGMGNTFFTSQEIKEIEQQPFIRSLAGFTPSRFQLRAYFGANSYTPGLASDLFFESVPDEWLDKSNSKWEWNENSRLIPVIIPQDYLNLYNFGFAGSQGLPQISEGIIQQLVFRIVVSGNGLQEIFDGQIVDFSSDLNTILVPESFMQWANNRFAPPEDTIPVSRLILEVKNPADPLIPAFFSSKPDYEVNNNKGEQGKLSYFLSLLIIAVMTAGGLIMLPSVGLMFLSINLIVYKNQKTLGDLILTGYRRFTLSLPYCLLILLLNLSVGIAALGIVRYVRNWYIPELAILGLKNLTSGFQSTVFFTLLFIFLLTLLDILWIKRKIGKIKIPVRG
ncbi:MAG: ABC transporter permease [Dysgonamonadaceae bacterium]|jgi:hypothetical protein|nr:ABC transporter permease [Dysgonamonadaceae bacterium]